MAGILFLVFAVEAALLHSKNPVFLFWSTKKLMYWAALAFAGGICLWAAKKSNLKLKIQLSCSSTRKTVFSFTGTDPFGGAGYSP